MIIALYILSVLIIAAAYSVSFYYWKNTFWNKDIARKLTIRILPVVAAALFSEGLLRYFSIEHTSTSRFIIILISILLAQAFMKWYKK